MSGIRRCAVLTYAPAVKHEVACAPIAQAPEDGRRTYERHARVHVRELRGAMHEDGVVGRGSPEAEVRLPLGRLPQRERVRNPVREEQACISCGFVRDCVVWWRCNL